ncbi:MAG TPA: hypothetical protein DCX27_21405 [Balneola sp.]|nr:hypothetical protein [Balneola sp.]|tara:strand:+ start:21 stop:755 length:735 start_codon:yes stop_codon:yes gene_type:complete
MSNNFWTSPKYQPMQQFRYDVQTVLFKANFSSRESEGRVLVNQPQSTEVAISKELIKAVNLPDVSLGYDNDAANIGSNGPSIESQDPQISELELQLYMTPQLAQDIQDIFRTYYLQDVEEFLGSFIGRPSKILNKDRVSLIPSPIFIKQSQIIVNIYDPSPMATSKKPATPAKSIVYYGIYPVSYNLGNLDYSSSDVVIGSMKFYFYGMEIRDGGSDATQSSQLQREILSSIGRVGSSCMGNYK